MPWLYRDGPVWPIIDLSLLGIWLNLYDPEWLRTGLVSPIQRYFLSFSGKPLWFVNPCIGRDDFDRVV
jgi:hypothetical protein